MANSEKEEPRKKVVAPVVQREKLNLLWGLLASVVSIIAHVLLALLVLFINVDATAAPSGEMGDETTVDDSEQDSTKDLTNIDLGINDKVELNYNVDRIEDVSVPGQVNPMETVGIVNQPDNTIKNIPLPPGIGGGTGAAITGEMGGANPFGTLGGMGGIYQPGGFGGRSGATREKMALEGGGNAASEVAVALGLQWLALHQQNDGAWSMTDYNLTTREKPLGQVGRVFPVTGGDKDKGASENKVAATAFALLPFLAAGQTHKFNKDNKIDYSKTVRGGLDWLIRQQGKDGAYGGGFYSHGVATIVMGEAYGMTSDPMLKASALAAMRYLFVSQHEGGGWRYAPKQAGDLSVTGWQVMGLKSCEMAGLPVLKESMLRLDRYLNDSYDDKSYTFSYEPGGGGGSPSMTAVGLLCKLYRGINPRNNVIIKGTEVLRRTPPAASMSNLYYAYYATQVMHHVGGADWDFWNLGPSGTGKDGMRDLLVKAQDKGDNPKKGFQAGSWPPLGGEGGSRVMSTSMCLLMLEVYYRHLPLYRRDLGVTKEMAK